MASHPPAQCCTIGVKHEGEASGKIEKIGDSKLTVLPSSLCEPYLTTPQLKCTFPTLLPKPIRPLSSSPT
jgi:hypothetical protein